MTFTRRITAFLVAAALACAPSATGPASAVAAQDNAAVAVNTRDGSSVFRLAFSIRRVMGDVVDAQNAAVAYSSCNSCQTVAIAIQVVLVASDPSMVTPTNLAIAINDNCTLCQTLASAYQFVVGGVGFQLTGQGRREVQRIRHGLRDLRRSDLSIEDIQSRTDALVSQLGDVLATELVARGPEPAPPEREGDQQQGPDATATTPTEAPATTTPAPTSESGETPTSTSSSPQDQATTPSSGDSDKAPTTTTPSGQ